MISGLVDLQIAAACVDFVAVGEKLAFRVAAERVGSNRLHEFRIAPAACFVFDVGRVVDNFTHGGKTRTFDDLNGNGIGSAVADFL